MPSERGDQLWSGSNSYIDVAGCSAPALDSISQYSIHYSRSQLFIPSTQRENEVTRLLGVDTVFDLIHQEPHSLQNDIDHVPHL